MWLSTPRRSCAFSYTLIKIWILFLGPFNDRPSLVQMMALVLSKRKSFICTNDCIVSWRIYASFGLKGLKHRFVLEIPQETWLPSVYCIYKCPGVTMNLVIFLSKCEFYSWGPFDNEAYLVHMMAWHWKAPSHCLHQWRHSSLTHTCVIRPQGIKASIVLDIPCEIWFTFVFCKCPGVIIHLVIFWFKSEF